MRSRTRPAGSARSPITSTIEMPHNSPTGFVVRLFPRFVLRLRADLAHLVDGDDGGLRSALFATFVVFAWRKRPGRTERSAGRDRRWRGSKARKRRRAAALWSSERRDLAEAAKGLPARGIQPRQCGTRAATAAEHVRPAMPRSASSPATGSGSSSCQRLSCIFSTLFARPMRCLPIAQRVGRPGKQLFDLTRPWRSKPDACLLFSSFTCGMADRSPAEHKDPAADLRIGRLMTFACWAPSFSVRWSSPSSGT